MKIQSARRPAAADTLICLHGGTGWQALPTALRQALDESWNGRDIVSLPSLGSCSHPRVVAVRHWPGEDAVAQRRLGGRIGRSLVGQAIGRASLDLEQPAEAYGPCLTGLIQGTYQWDRYLPKPLPRVAQLKVVGAKAAQVRAWQAAATRLDRCRDLINTPTADCGPAEFVAQARQACRNTGLRLRVIDEAGCRKQRMGCLLAVGRAAARDRRPRMLVIDWPGRGSRPGGRLALCGKGVCFDTGGLQIKPGKSMELMRKDMGGAATVLAAMLGIAAADLRRPVRAYLPLVENAIDGSAFRPGDILTAMDGTTVEVGHTDAEGRLILADAMALARRERAAALVTVATLTGAAMVALGRIHVPIMGSDQALVDALVAAATAAGEKVWQLPLDDDHRAMVRSQVATVTNSAGPEASCITAGAFLAHFAADLPFLHCDISPASWMPSEHDCGPAGATGVLVESLIGLAERWS